ncbi:hypothetical protein [Ralstonia sp. SET104]|uniref:hypothetical protein n=1 Tax=Ralstonia sp. SET104 TaxID=2448774 RepID=UPI000FF937D7|nr:hypothetical protein [Ralstonia sp. SET104]GCB06784.1 hypothetical protein PSUB009319_44150 [Ralstonia sp. SET104]
MSKFATLRGSSPATTDPATSRMSLCFIAAALLCTAFAGCSKPTDAVVPTDPKQWDGEFAQKIKNLSEADKGLLAAYLLRTQLGEVFGKQGMPVGTTVGQAIDAQRQWIAEQDAKKAAAQRLKAEIEAKQATTAAELSKTIVLTFIGQRYIPQDLDAGQIYNRFSVQIGVKNLGNKAIKGVKLQLAFKNTFGEIISKTPLNIEHAIPPGGEYVWKGIRKVNEFTDEGRKLMDLEDGQFSTEMQPTMVVYADGSTVGSPDAN